MPSFVDQTTSPARAKARAAPNFRRMKPQLQQQYADVLQEAEEYDPYAAATRSSKAQFESFQPDLERGIRDLRGSQVGMGRLQTGYGQEDEDYLVSEGIQDLNRQIAQRSLDASRLELEGRGQRGDFIAGGLDRGRQEEEDEREKKAGGWRGFLGGVAGTALGSLVGPVGSAVGAKLGSRIAQSI